GEDGVDRDAGTGAVLGESARNGELRGFGGSVVNHLYRNLDAAFAADENDAAPVTLLHARQVSAAEADAAENVGIEEPHPVFVGDLFERLWLENAEIIDEDIDRGELLHQRCCVFRAREIADE